MEIEIWKDIPGYEGVYQASNLGNVRSLDRYVRQFTHGYEDTRYIKGVVLVQKIKNNGYLSVCLSNCNKQKHYSVHRLVWKAFNGEIPEGLVINHLNECKTDNRLCNLELVTAKENLNWGTSKQRLGVSKGKPVIQYDKDWNYIKEYVSASEAGRETGVNFSKIALVCNGKRNVAGGFIWKYK
ncbi:MAG: HNH endonuclease [Bacteroidales bacterium]|nr:HNH endonuclease [Bacteroidales bacterium]